MLPAPSHLSVSCLPGTCLRHRCSSRYLQISPLHLEFQFRLSNSSPVVPSAVHGLSPWISHQACRAAYMPFTPNNSEQRSQLTCYRGCWHVISRCLFRVYRHHQAIPCPAYSSTPKGLYNLPAFLVHAASLRQTFVHCGIFLAAASRRSLGRISVPMCPSTLSGRIPIIALVRRYRTNKLMGRGPILRRGHSPFPRGPLTTALVFGITRYFYRLSPTRGYVTHVLLTSPPLSDRSKLLSCRPTCMLKTHRQRSF